MVHAGGERLTGLHYGTYDYSAFCGIAAGHQSLEHPVADHAKLVMQAAAAGTGVRLSDGSTNVLPVGDADDGPRRLGATTTAWSAARSSAATTRAGTCTRPSCRRGTPRRTRFYREGCRAALDRLAAYVGHAEGGDRRRAGHRPRARRRTCCAASTAAPSTRPRCAGSTSRTVRSSWRTGQASGHGGWASSWERTSTARRRTASSASSATPRATRSATSTCRPRCAATSRDAHTTGDQAQVLPTDTQKNTAFAYAKMHGDRLVEDYALALGGRLLEASPAASAAQVRVEEYAWDRLGQTTRSCAAAARSAPAWSPSAATRPTCCPASRTWCVLKSTDSEFKGFLKDEFTTLPRPTTGSWRPRWSPTWRHAEHATSTGTRRTTRCRRLPARDLRHARTPARCRRPCTRWARAVLDSPARDRRDPFSAPNKHHFLVDFSGFDVEGLTNDGEVFIAADRPYGLIEAR